MPVKRRLLGFQLGGIFYLAGLYQSSDLVERQPNLSGPGWQVRARGRRAEASGRPTGWKRSAIGAGFVQFRWQRVSRELTEADGPTVELVDFDAIRRHCRITSLARFPGMIGEARIALRQRQIATRMLPLTRMLKRR